MTRHSRRKMSISALLFALVLVLAGSGCAGTAAREQGWLEVRSANFSIYTPLAERAAREMLEDFELFRAAVLTVTKMGSVQPQLPTEVYVFQSEGDFRPFDPRENAAAFFRPTLRVNFAALAVGARAEEARATFYHQYTHFLLQNEGAGHHPLWFDEGFAELLSSIEVRGKNVRIGDPPKQHASWLRSGSSMPYSRVIRARRSQDFSEDELEMFYAQSWLLVHHLMLGKDSNDFAAQMQRYVERIERGAEPEGAFRESFG